MCTLLLMINVAKRLFFTAYSCGEVDKMMTCFYLWLLKGYSVKCNYSAEGRAFVCTTGSISVVNIA